MPRIPANLNWASRKCPTHVLIACGDTRKQSGSPPPSSPPPHTSVVLCCYCADLCRGGKAGGTGRRKEPTGTHTTVRPRHAPRRPYLHMSPSPPPSNFLPPPFQTLCPHSDYRRKGQLVVGRGSSVQPPLPTPNTALSFPFSAKVCLPEEKGVGGGGAKGHDGRRRRRRWRRRR